MTTTTTTYRVARTASAGTTLLAWLVITAATLALAATPARAWVSATCASDAAAASPAYVTACDALADRGW